MRNVKILGSGCRNCQTTYELVKQVAAERGVAIELEKVEEMARILGYGVMSTPGVVIDDRVVHSGSVPSRKAVESWFS